MAQYIVIGNIKALDTGAESTIFNTPKEIEEYCKARSNYYAKKSMKLNYEGSLIALVEQETIAGGAY